MELIELLFQFYSSPTVSYLPKKKGEKISSRRREHGKLIHIGCGNHILNLIVKTGLEKADATIAKIREGVKHIKNSETRIMKFVECLSNLGLSCSKKLRQDMPIRWNSTYQILESALLYRQAYIHYNLIG